MTTVQSAASTIVRAGDALSRPMALALLDLLATVWGVNWSVIKLTVQSVPPLWMTAIRCAIAAVALLATSLGLLAAPIIGILSAAIWLREPLSPSLLVALALMTAGIVLGTMQDNATSATVKGSAK